MLFLALLGLALAGGLYYLTKKDPNKTTSLPPFSLENDMIDGLPIKRTDVYYYPYDQVPEMLQKTQGVLPYDQHYGCPSGYVPQQLYSQGGGPDYTGTPGMVRPVTYCQLAALPGQPDPYRYPLDVYNIPGEEGNSSAFRDWASYHQIMTNLMVQQDNTITPSTVFGDRFDIRPVVGHKGLQYGGLGRLPDPVTYPQYILY